MFRTKKNTHSQTKENAPYEDSLLNSDPDKTTIRKLFKFTNISHLRIMDVYEIKMYQNEMFAFLQNQINHEKAGMSLTSVSVDSQSVSVHDDVDKATLHVVTSMTVTLTTAEASEIEGVLTRGINFNGGRLVGRLWQASRGVGYFGTLDAISVMSYPEGELEASHNETTQAFDIPDEEEDPFANVNFDFDDPDFFEKNFMGPGSMEEKQLPSEDNGNSDLSIPSHANNANGLTNEYTNSVGYGVDHNQPIIENNSYALFGKIFASVLVCGIVVVTLVTFFNKVEPRISAMVNKTDHSEDEVEVIDFGDDDYDDDNSEEDMKFSEIRALLKELQDDPK